MDHSVQVTYASPPNPYKADDGKWWWYDETGDNYGPYDDEGKAKAALGSHCVWNHGPQPGEFEYVSKLSMDRSNAWLGDAGWTKADFSNAFVGESGEVVEAVGDLLVLVSKMSSAHGKLANAIKKLRRHETGVSQSKGPQTIEAALENVKKEIGDSYIYLDLLAQVCGLKMYDCIKTTFNRVSEREGFPQRME